MHLKVEMDAIEAELALIAGDAEDQDSQAADLVREVADVRARLSKAGGTSKKDVTRGKLVKAVLYGGAGQPAKFTDLSADSTPKIEEHGLSGDNNEEELDMLKFTAEIDRRLGTLEKIIGSSSTVLDEVKRSSHLSLLEFANMLLVQTSPLLPPLVVTVTRLHSMLTLLSQPRQLDNVSRRLKLIQPDLERTVNASHANHTPHSASMSASQRRQPSGHALNSSISSNTPASPTVASTQSFAPNRTHLEQLSPILTRLAPILPNIPHILTRLRSLSTLHTNAAAFQSTLERLEEQQAKERAELAELERALEGIEKSIKENETVVKKNVESLEARVDNVTQRIESVDVDV